ncbi:hypothetical protein [Loktanella sp. M215]|uniref:hypothetical protein n=1 Tax=Loktanella sp. M215 TaxID=2675431 RepID=UPI001F402F51|nr:hypothetical protein [Loktanella sp. M215]MCF7700938.1 hypothetical protein [Loktanella sp. M215]
MKTNVLVVGDSNVGAIKAGFERVLSNEHKADRLCVKYLACAGPNFGKLDISGSLLTFPEEVSNHIWFSWGAAPGPNILDFDVIIFASGKSVLDPRNFICGKWLNNLSYELISDIVRSVPSSVILFSKILACCDERELIFVGAPPLCEQQSPFLNGGVKGCEKEYLNVLSQEIRSFVQLSNGEKSFKTLLPPKDVLSDDGMHTRLEMVRAGLRFDGRTERKPEDPDYGDLTHGNVAYGESIVRSLLSIIDKPLSSPAAANFAHGK